MEIRGEHGKQRVRFDSIKEGEPFYYNGELLMKTSEITDNSGFYGGWRQLDNCCSVWWIARKLDNIETKMKK